MVVSQAASLIDGVLETFIDAAGRRCLAVRASPPSRPEAPTRPIAGEFGSALRSLSCAVGQDCVEVLKALLSWYDSGRRAAAQEADDDARAVADCALNCTFCEALVVALGGAAAACCEPLVLDAVQTRCLDFYQLVLQTPGRQELARRRLEALGGRSELSLWSRLLGVLSRYRFEALANTLLGQLELAGGDGGAVGGRSGRAAAGRAAAAPSRGALAMCLALRGLRLPSPGRTGGAAQARAFLERVERLLAAKQLRGLMRPVCEALGEALLDQAAPPHDEILASDEAEAATTAIATPAAAAAAAEGWDDERVRAGWDAADAHAAEELQLLCLRLAEKAERKVGLPRAFTAKFESWAAPFATGLLWLAEASLSVSFSRGAGAGAIAGVGAGAGAGGGGGTPGGGGGGGGGAHTEAELIETAHRLQARLLKCLRQPDAAHRLLALRCVRLQLPLLLSPRHTPEITRHQHERLLPLLHELFVGPSTSRQALPALQHEHPTAANAAELLRRYSELLDGLSHAALSLGPPLAMRRVVLPALHGREGKLRQPTIVSLNTLRLLLHQQPRAALGAADSPAEVLGAVLGVVRQSAASFKEDAPKSAMWLHTLQLLRTSLLCLAEWPADAATAAAAPLPAAELLPLLAPHLCARQRPTQLAAAALISRLAAPRDAAGAAALPLALHALADAVAALLDAAPEGRRAALRHATQLLAPIVAALPAALDREEDAAAAPAAAPYGAPFVSGASAAPASQASPPLLAGLREAACRLQAAALLQLTDGQSQVRGEAVQLLELLGAELPAAEGGRRGAPPRRLVPEPSVAEVLRGALVRATARAVRDPLALELWGGAMEGAESVRGAARLRRAASSGALRAHAEAVAGSSEGEATLWLCCLQGLAAAVGAAAPLPVVTAAWAALQPRCGRTPAAAPLPARWAACANLAVGLAGRVLSTEGHGPSHGAREQAQRLVLGAAQQLLGDSEPHAAAASAALGQLRGAAALQLLLSALAPALQSASLGGKGGNSDGEFRADVAKNAGSRFHAHMRQLSHVLALASEMPEWDRHLAACAEQLRPLAQWTHSALEYLSLPCNLTAWSLQR